MAFTFAMFTMVAFASTKNEKNTIPKSTKKVIKGREAKDDCYTLIKIWFYEDCPWSWYDVSEVVTIKVWCDPNKNIEVYDWNQNADLVCS